MVIVKNSDYWKNRFEELENIQYLASEHYCKDLQKQFRMAQNDMKADIEKWYRRLADNNDISYAAAQKLLSKNELEEFRWSVQDYIKYGKKNGLNKQWTKQLENASAKVHISRLDAMKLQIQQHAERLFQEYEKGTSNFLSKSYSDQFYHIAYEMAKGTSIGSNLSKIDERKITAFLQKPWAQDGANFSDRIWKNKEKLINTLHTELAQNIIRGSSPTKAIENIANTMNVSYHSATNLILTESAAISSMATQDCYKELELEQYEILVTLDNRTSEICRKMDGKIFSMKDYKVGLTAPPFHPRCRSTTIPVIDEDFMAGEKRTARNEKTKKTYYVPGNMKYEDWFKKYVTRGNSDGIIKVNEIKEVLSRQLQLLTDQEKKVITNYTGFGAQRINHAVYTGVGFDKVKDMIKILDNALEKGTAIEEMIVYRKTVIEYLNAFPKGYRPSGQDIFRLKGRILENKAFMSTSLEKTDLQGRNVEIILTIPKGYRGGLYIKELSHIKYKDQEEFLLKRNVHYFIRAVSFKDGIYYLEAEVMQ